MFKAVAAIVTVIVTVDAKRDDYNKKTKRNLKGAPTPTPASCQSSHKGCETVVAGASCTPTDCGGDTPVSGT